MERKNEALDFIRDLDREKNFFEGVDLVNKYNINALIELIQYDNMKEFGDPLFTRKELREGIKTFWHDNMDI